MPKKQPPYMNNCKITAAVVDRYGSTDLEL